MFDQDLIGPETISLLIVQVSCHKPKNYYFSLMTKTLDTS
jgi:hypothetical protein